MELCKRMEQSRRMTANLAAIMKKDVYLSDYFSKDDYDYKKYFGGAS